LSGCPQLFLTPIWRLIEHHEHHLVRSGNAPRRPKSLTTNIDRVRRWSSGDNEVAADLTV
jgi:hypothetical protein